jgi:NADH-quinone oxidoreductase subunit M
MGGPTADAAKDMPDLSGREKLAIGPIIAVIVAMGFFPQPVLNVITPSVEQTLVRVDRHDPAPEIAGTAENGAHP